MIFKESRILELKKQYTPSILKTVSAFATYETGTIIFGVDDDGTIVGIVSIDELKLKVENAIRNNISSLPYYTFHEVFIEHKSIINQTLQRRFINV